MRSTPVLRQSWLVCRIDGTQEPIGNSEEYGYSSVSDYSRAEHNGRTHDTINRDCWSRSTKPETTPPPSTPKPSTSVPMTDRYVKLELVKLDIKPGDRITVSDNLLASIPVSKYMVPKTVSSEDTVDYWPSDEDKQHCLLQTSRPPTTPKVPKNVQRRTFAMSTHGIRR